MQATWIALTLVIALAIADAVLSPIPDSTQPGFIDAVLASRAVVAAIRIAIVFAAVFVVLSVIALTAQRRWLVRVGPVEVSDQVSDLEAESRRLEKDLEEANRAIDGLERTLRIHIN